MCHSGSDDYWPCTWQGGALSPRGIRELIRPLPIANVVIWILDRSGNVFVVKLAS